MNAINRRSFFHVRRCAWCIVCIVAGGVMVSPVMAQNVGARLLDGGDTFDYTFSGAGSLPVVSQGPIGWVPMNFQLNGFPGNQAAQQVVAGNWFYRIAGDDRERHLANAATRSLSGSNYVKYTFDKVYEGGAAEIEVPDVWAEMDFLLSDTGPSSSLLSTQVCFHNDGSTPIDIDTFLAVDFNLAATAGFDAYDPLITTGGRLWRLSDGPWVGLMYGPGAIGAGAANATTIFDRMTNSSLNNFTSALNPGGGTFTDGAAVLQFHLSVAGQTVICVPAYLAIGVGVEPPLEIIPEPSGLVLLALAATIFLFRPRCAQVF